MERKENEPRWRSIRERRGSEGTGTRKNNNFYRKQRTEVENETFEYERVWYGSRLVKAPVKFPSTKMCSRCGHINPSLLLSQRTFQCEDCLMECDRDVNAAKNLERYALTPLDRKAYLTGLTTVSSTGIDACGEAVQQGSSMKQEENAVYPAGING